MDPALAEVSSAASSVSGLGLGLNLSTLSTGLDNPITQMLMAQLQTNQQRGPSSKRRRTEPKPAPPDRKARACTSDNYPAGRDTIASLPDQDVLHLLEKMEPISYNRYVMDPTDRATRNACLMHALGRGLHDKIVCNSRTQHEASCMGRYQQLGCPLKGKTPREVVQIVMDKLQPSQTGRGYSVHCTADGKQYIHNGISSRWIDEGIGLSPAPPQYHLYVTPQGQSYITNGQQSMWVDKVFEDRASLLNDTSHTWADAHTCT